MSSGRLVQALALACLFASIACGRGDEGSGAPGPVAAAAPISTPPGAADAEAELPPQGNVRAWLAGDGLVNVVANQAPRGAVVAALAEAADFELVVGEGANLDVPVTLRVQGEALALALARILEGVSHTVAFLPDPSGAPHLARLTLGVLEAPQLASKPVGRIRQLAEQPRPELTPEQREERAERGQQLHEESLANLGSRDASVRADAAKWLDVSSSEGFQAATDHLANDPAPEVRAAAAEVLLDSSIGAVQPLLQALNDPDSRVVLAALEAIEFVGDESTAPLLAPLLKHKDVEVRERTVEAMEFLQ